MSFAKNSAAIKKKVNARLIKYFSAKILATDSESEKRLLKDLREFVLRGGKRLRPFLLMESYRLLGGNNQKAILDFACGLEIGHAALLIHDDIIDNDKTRRGQKTLHYHYQNLNKKTGTQNLRQSEKSALIAGDFLSHLGTELILESDFPATKKVKALAFLQEKLWLTGIGEFLDIHFSHPTKINRVPADKILTLKTAQYTAVSPIGVAAILATNLSAKQFRSLTKFGLLVGESFQLRDDILDFFGNPKLTGKAIGSDFKEGHLTPLIKLLLQKAGPVNSIILRKNFGKNNLTDREFILVRKIAKEIKTEQIINNRALILSQEAKKEIVNRSLPKPLINFYWQFADYLINRNV